MSKVPPRGVWVAVQIITLVFILALFPGCAARREVTPDPIQISRPLPIVVKKEAWSAIVSTILLEGEVIRDIHPSVDRVTFYRILTEDNFRLLCKVGDVRSVNVDSWKFNTGRIDVTVWLDGKESSDPTELQLIMEGRCRATFSPPEVRTWLLAPWPISIPVMILTGGRASEWAYEPRSVVLTSTGKLERDLQEKILTTLGVDLPPWLIKQR